VKPLSKDSSFLFYLPSDDKGKIHPKATTVYSVTRTYVLICKCIYKRINEEGPGEESLEGKRGAPKGNQYARKHGFYSKVLDEVEQLDFELATSVEGIDDEIALLRVKIKSLLERDPENIKLIMQAINALVRLVRTKYNIGKEDRKGLKEAIGNVLKDIALPIGIGIGTTLKK
jgi:hypothetical protein